MSAPPNPDGACPRCGVPADEGGWCGLCGLNLRPEASHERFSRAAEERNALWMEDPDAAVAAYEQRRGVDVSVLLGHGEAESADSEDVGRAEDDTGTKVCPECAETVQAAARVCRFCGYRFAPPVAAGTAPEVASGSAPAVASAPSAAPRRAPTPSGFAFWNGQTFVGFGSLGLIVLALLFFTHSGPFHQEKCVITALGGNKLCGDEARAWCDSTDALRDLSGDASSQAVCDELRSH